MAAEKPKKQILVIYIFLQILLVVIVFFIGFMTKELFTLKKSTFPVFDEAYRIFTSHALLPVPESQSLEYGMIQGMLTSYNDPNTVFVAPPQNELQTDTLTGSYGGIGARLELDNHNNFLLYPYDDSPAGKAGILPADILIEVDKLAITVDTPLDSVESALRGDIGSKVKIKIFRGLENRILEFNILRETFAIPSVTYNLLPENKAFGLIKITQIAESTPDEVDLALNELQQNGAEYLLLDLRDNSGGLVESGVEISRMFLEEGVVIQQQYRDKNVETYRVIRPGRYAHIPMVILVNHGTASAAEIIAGSLSAQGRAILIGTQTYGKDTIQLVFTLQDQSSIHVTSAHWWVPGLSFDPDFIGLMPDILLSDQQANDSRIFQVAVDELLPDLRDGR